MQQIKEHGSVTRGWLGVEIQNLTPDMAASLGVAGQRRHRRQRRRRQPGREGGLPARATSCCR